MLLTAIDPLDRFLARPPPSEDLMSDTRYNAQVATPPVPATPAPAQRKTFVPPMVEDLGGLGSLTQLGGSL
jgi:hypothetical protein